MVNIGIKKSGISFQEKTYINWEVKFKHAESKLWGMLMGPFGGCFAIRKSLFTPIPENFLVDDFYVCMNILQNGLHLAATERNLVMGQLILKACIMIS